MAEFDRYSSDYEDAIERAIAFGGRSHDFYVRAKARRLLEVWRARLGGLESVRALDVGCGVGIHHPWLAPALGSLTGVDPSAESIERAQAENPGVAYAVVDGTRLPFEDARFDVAFAICVLHHVAHAEQIAFARELVRVVRPGGLVSVVEHNPVNPLTRLVVSRCDFDEDVELLRPSAVSRLLGAVGADVVDRRYILFVPWEADRLEHALARVPLGAQHVVTARA